MSYTLHITGSKADAILCSRSDALGAAVWDEVSDMKVPR